MNAFLVSCVLCTFSSSPDTYTPQQRQAANTAVQAALIQVGLTAQIDRIQNALENQARWYANRLGAAEEIGVAMIIYQTAQTKTVILPVSSNMTIRVNPSSMFMELRF